MAFLTTAHAQLTRDRQEVLISGPENQWLARTRGPWHPTFNYSMHREKWYVHPHYEYSMHRKSDTYVHTYYEYCTLSSHFLKLRQCRSCQGWPPSSTPWSHILCWPCRNTRGWHNLWLCSVSSTFLMHSSELVLAIVSWVLEWPLKLWEAEPG